MQEIKTQTQLLLQTQQGHKSWEGVSGEAEYCLETAVPRWIFASPSSRNRGIASAEEQSLRSQWGHL